MCTCNQGYSGNGVNCSGIMYRNVTIYKVKVDQKYLLWVSPETFLVCHIPLLYNLNKALLTEKKTVKSVELFKEFMFLLCETL